MKVVKEAGVESDICPECGGIWVDNFEEKQVLKMSPEVFTIDELRRLREVYKPLGRVEKTKYFKCPRCRKYMWRKNYMSHSGILVDKCRKHGTFFDKGELEKAVEFIKAGGVEYQKLKITERGLYRMQGKLTREISRVERADLLGRKARWLMFLGF
jgi:Zn-finger nucleic acid-binding protein